MSTDTIKDALIAAYPDTSAKDWKRRSKQKVNGNTHRSFENTETGWQITVIEDASGNISFGDSRAGESEPTLAEKITETGKQIVREMAAAVGLSTDTDGVAPKPKKTIDTTPLEPGDKMQIPAGTRVFELSYSGTADGSSIAKRAITATFVGKCQINNWLTIAPEENIAEIEALMSKAWGGRDQTGSAKYLLDWIRNENRERGTPFARGTQYSRDANIAAALMTAQQAVKDEFGEKPVFAMWGSGSTQKAAFLPKVIKLASKAEAEKAAPKKEAKITKRRLMVEGSTWRFTRDVELVMWIDNPKIGQLIRQRDSLSRSPHSQTRMSNGTILIGLGGGTPNTAAEETQIQAIQAEINRISKEEKQIQIKVGVVKAGTVIEIKDKLSPSTYSYGAKEKSNGLNVPCAVLSGSVETVEINSGGWNSHPLKGSYRDKGWTWVECYTFPYSMIEGAVEALAIPEAIVYALRDNATGEFFGGWETELSGRYNRGTNTPKMSKTFSGAKKYKTSSAAKASIRDFTGYNSGINDDGESADAYWAVGGDKKIDLPATWEIVAIDKTTNAEKEVIEVQEWFKNLMRLRVLTQKHCSAVRSAYKKAEESDHTFEAIVLFQNRDKGSTTYKNGNTSEWDQAVPFEDELDEGKSILDAIKAAADNMGGKTIRVKSQSAVAYACSLEDGVTAKLMFRHPTVITRLLDINSLEDVVESGAEAEKPITHKYTIDGVEHSY